MVETFRDGGEFEKKNEVPASEHKFENRKGHTHTQFKAMSQSCRNTRMT